MASHLQPYLIGDGWMEVRDGNDTARAIFDRHYSRRRYPDGRTALKFTGPGSPIVLVQADASAVFAWRKFISDDDQTGVNCAIFRNEGDGVASELIRAAIPFALRKWPDERRFYTYVDPRKVPPTMFRGYPVWGWCFYKAGWSYVGMSKKAGRHILAITL